MAASVLQVLSTATLPQNTNTQKSVAPLAEYIIVCSKLPIDPSVLRTKINETLSSYGHQLSNHGNLPFDPYVPDVSFLPSEVLAQVEQREQDEVDRHYREQGEEERKRYHILTQPPWNARFRVFEGIAYFAQLIFRKR